MWLSDPFNGANLQPNQICLTYDDGPGFTSGLGPGPHTVQLAQYLSDQGIQATFFVTGRHVEDFAGVVERLRDLGHLVGNHTYDHANLPIFMASGGDIADQVLRTTSLIRSSVLNTTNTIFFRPPYGEWASDLASVLNNNLLTALGHVGPVNWNMPDDDTDADWACWQKGTDPAKCADNYFNYIMKIRQGIILMHDSTADSSQLMKKNLTWRLTQLLVPKLKAAGFHFLRIDADPDISAFASKPLRAALKGSNNKWITTQKGTEGRILVDGHQPGDLQKLRIVDLGNCRVALQTPNGFDNMMGQYFSVQNQGTGPVSATADSIGDWETFDVIVVGGELAFRTFSGSFLTYDPNSLELTSTGTSLQSQQLFGFYNYFSHH